MTGSGQAGAGDLGARVRARLSEHVARQSEVLAKLGPELQEPVRVLDSLLAGGKRLRPALCYWGFRGAGGSDCEGIVTAAASLELLHVSALIHDDVMDASDLRRGRPAAHRQFAGAHTEAGWVGSPDRFGAGAAILLGDLCLGWSAEMLSGCGLPAERVSSARRVHAAMRTEVVAGQYLDLVAQADPGTDTDRTLRVARFKTALYTVVRPLQLGGTLAGAADGLLEAYAAVGTPLGEAFQLRDDLLGVFGDPGRTGKPAGGDLREGKRTALVAEALAVADRRTRERVLALLGSPDLDARGVEVLRAVLVDTGAVERVEARIAALATTATDALAATPLPPETRTELEQLAAAATHREA